MVNVGRLRLLKFIFGALYLVSATIGFIMFLGAANADGGLIVFAAIFGVLFLIFFGIYKNIDKKLKSLCYSCGNSIKGAAYEFQEVGRDENNQGDVTATVEFSAECPHCQKEKTFRKKYKVYYAGRYNSNTGQSSNPKSYNIQYSVEKDAKKFFGN